MPRGYAAEKANWPESGWAVKRLSGLGVWLEAVQRRGKDWLAVEASLSDWLGRWLEAVQRRGKDCRG